MLLVRLVVVAVSLPVYVLLVCEVIVPVTVVTVWLLLLVLVDSLLLLTESVVTV
jgi:hypothetical protein